MIKISGFRIEKKIHNGASAQAYSGFRENDSHAVVIKLLAGKYPSVEEVARFRREYEVLKSLQGEGTVRVYNFEPFQNSFAIIMDNFGRSVHELIEERSLNLKDFLQMAIKTVEALEVIHAHQIVHKDINPHNILWDADTEQIKIIDFGISSTLPREEIEIQNLNIIEGMLPYMSPEQTGRMNRGVDYRTDFYSAGMVFYEMVTGKPPFESKDPLELVHYQLAMQPVSPHQVNAAIPEAISAIIAKMTAKAAEDRYQSTYGIKADLQHCLDLLKTTDRIDFFKPGMQDISARFHIPEKLYGREKEITQLLQAFEEISGGLSKVLLVSGYSGVGKSRLIHEVHKPIVEKRGYFISGKFDQFKRNIPYASLIQAFEELIQQILMESNAQIKQWKKQISTALGPNGQVVVDVIPELAAIIGPQPVAVSLDPVASQQRFNHVFQKFIQALASEDHPLVIFLDDLQWIDSSSLKLLEILLSNADNHHFLMIGAYRDNEVDATHPLMNTLENLQKSTIEISNISLKPLEPMHVEHLLIDTLHSNLETIKPLSDICYKKTQGNPFFLTQFLMTLYQEKLINFNYIKGHWEWDIKQIQKAGYTNNVVEFMVRKVRDFPLDAQKVLQLAACLGNRFDLEMLAAIYQKSPKETADALWPTLEEGLVIPTNDEYRYAAYNHSEQGQTVDYHFLHDRVQQAAYSLIEEKKRDLIHLMIGRLLLKKTPEDKLTENILEIINHFNQGIDLVDTAEEKSQLAKLNFIAGQRAKASIAYQPALNYFQTGILLLSENSWQEDYHFSLELYTEATEAAYLAMKFEEMERLEKIVLQHAKTPLEKTKVYEIKITYFASLGMFSNAIKLALEMLSLLGIHIPENPTKLSVLMGVISTKYRLYGKTMEDLYNLPAMVNERWLAVMRILEFAAAAAYQANPNLLVLLSLRLIELTVKYGSALHNI